MANFRKFVPLLLLWGVSLGSGSSTLAQPTEPAAPLAQLPPPPEAQPLSRWDAPLTGLVNPPPLPQVIFNFVADPQAVVPPEDRKQFLDRLFAYDDCVQDWLRGTASLTDAQAAAFKETLPKFDTPQSEELLREILTDSSRSLPAWLPGLFTGQLPAMTVIDKRLPTTELFKSLSEDQVFAFTRAREEQLGFRRQAYDDYLLALLDAELYLSKDQREILRAGMNKGVRQDPFYAADMASSYLPYKSLAAIVPVVVKEKLSPAQQQRLSTLQDYVNGAAMPRVLSFSSVDSPEKWEEQIETYIQQLRKETLQVLELRVDYLQREKLLTEQQLNQLRFAAKAVAVQHCDERKETVLSNLQQILPQLRRQVGNTTYGFSSTPPRPATLFSHPHWRSAWETVMGNPQANLDAERLAKNREARDRAVLALLDEELWLSPAQRANLLPLISSVLPPVEVLTVSTERVREIAWLAHVLVLLKPEQLQPILDPAQLAAWEEMQKSFPLAANVTVWQVRMTMRNGGSLSIPLYNPDGSRKAGQPNIQPQQAAPIPKQFNIAPAAPRGIEEVIPRRQ